MKPCHSTIRGILAAGLISVLPASVLNAEECLRTPVGTPVKLIVREACALYEEPDANSPNKPLAMFEWFYLLGIEANSDVREKDGFYRVSYTAETQRAAGWIPKEKALEWNHAQVTGFSANPSREKVLFFATPEEAKAWYRGEAAADRKAISKEPSQKTSKLFPLLAVEKFQHDGEEIELYKMAYLSGGTRASSGPSPSGKMPSIREQAPRTERELQSRLKLQVCIVIDTTGSMQEFIDAMKAAMAKLTDELANNPVLAGRIEFSLVCYRDELDSSNEDRDQMEYVAKVVSGLTSDHEAFKQEISDVRAARVSSEEFTEDGLAGLSTAFDEIKWDAAAIKVIVLVGDAPFHTSTDTYKNTTRESIPGLLAKLQPEGSESAFRQIQINALRIVSKDAVTAERQFSELVNGRRGQPGIHVAFHGQEDADEFNRELVESLSTLAKAAGNVVSGKSGDVQKDYEDAAPGSAERRLMGPVLEMIRAVEGGSDQPTFEEGYAVVLDPEGNKALDPLVLVSQSQLKTFGSALDFIVKNLESVADPGQRNVKSLVQSLQLISSNVNLKEAFHGDMKFSEVLSRVLGFPVKNPIFSVTPTKLAAMTAADFNGWLDQVRASHSIANAHVENAPIWFELGKRGHRSTRLHAFIKVSDLP